MKKFLFIVPVLLFVSACNNAVNVETIDTSSPDAYLGLTLEQATKNAQTTNTPFRMVMEDGESLPVTADYVVGRINATVENGIVKSYTIEGEENAEVAPYDQDSWKTMIPETCTSFFDGCNSCTRMKDDSEAACTRMFCETYEQPVCKDDL